MKQAFAKRRLRAIQKGPQLAWHIVQLHTDLENDAALMVSDQLSNYSSCEQNSVQS